MVDDVMSDVIGDVVMDADATGVDVIYDGAINVDVISDDVCVDDVINVVKINLGNDIIILDMEVM
jgi:hypothetical protein